MAARSIPTALLLLAAVLILAGCGSVFVGFVSNPGNPSTVTGKVLAVSVVSINDHTGHPLTVTRVTLTGAGLANSLSFCGDQQVNFPINATVKVEFNSGIDCMSIVNVVILSTDSPSSS